ncbi:ankyrin repeat-containing protein P16F5.05c-like [Mangifera indica]|uniref:ankyrin repeat-containing protein P16F5.05c-like n=1 Tax=Mangifera indica TaxID=29780 RepID=UPI001CFAACD2|nr:ankyrin repeat-containing protein P16F5.05c-like [Mangifera indica]
MAPGREQFHQPFSTPTPHPPPKKKKKHYEAQESKWAKRQTQLQSIPKSTRPTIENTEALLQAARYDDIDDIISLESAGVSLYSKDSQGRTALHMAAANGHLGIVDYLVSRERDVNASNEEKNTPLHWDCLNGHIEVVKLLILAGANVSMLNSHERTPMDEAVSRGKMDVIDAINAAAAQVEHGNVPVS